MEQILIENDIPVYRIKASSFPAGIKSAHEKVHMLFPPNGTRKYYGISQGAAKGQILYWAAVSRQPGETEQNDETESFVIRKGKYISIYIKNWMLNEASVAEAFHQLLQHDGIDMKGYCLEEYVNETDIRCSVPLL